MVNTQTCYCENCSRLSESIEINRVTVNNHTALLCLACAHVLTLPHNKERFLQLVRSKTIHQSNSEMQKAHQILSVFIAVGALFLIGIVSAEVAQSYDFTTLAFNEIQSISSNGPLSFLQLKSFD